MAALLLLASGCSVQQEYPAALPLSEATPPPLQSQESRMLPLPLYFVAADGRNLVEEIRPVSCDAEESIAQAMLTELFDGSVPTGLATAIPVDWKLSKVTVSGGTADVYVMAEGASSVNAYLTGRAAIAAALSAGLNVPYCNVFVNGILPGYLDRPLGAMQPITGALDVYLANMKQTFDPAEPVEVTEAGEYDNRNAILYFTDAVGQFLLADVRVMRYDAKASLQLIVTSLIEELMKGPLESEGREPVLPADMLLSDVSIRKVQLGLPAAQTAPDAADSTEPVATEAPQQEDAPIVVEVNFTKSGTAFNKRLVYGAIVYTVTGYCPNALGLLILENGVAVKPDAVRDTALNELRDYLTRDDFSGVIGHTVPLAFPESDGSGLHRVMRSMDEAVADVPMARLLALFTGSADPGVPYALFSSEDVLGVSLQDDMAVVNWKAGFLDKLRAYINSGQTQLPPNTREQMLVFGVVDTLTAIPGIKRVWMLEDGVRINDSAELVFLGDPLLKNPGLLLD